MRFLNNSIELNDKEIIKITHYSISNHNLLIYRILLQMKFYKTNKELSIFFLNSKLNWKINFFEKYKLLSLFTLARGPVMALLLTHHHTTSHYHCCLDTERNTKVNKKNTKISPVKYLRVLDTLILMTKTIYKLRNFHDDF